MNSSTVWKLVCLSAAVGICSQVMVAQGVPYPLAPRGTLPPGFMRPHVWMVEAPAAVVHGPGMTTCGISDVCYYVPSDLQTAYATNFIQNANGGAGMTIAIVDAFHYAGAENDLSVFSSQFGLPSCTTDTGCLTIVNQIGGPSRAGTAPQSWAVEVDLDLQWAHAIAPNASLLLVEGDTNSFTDLAAAVLYAQLHAAVVSNSYGAVEFSGETALDGTYSGSPVPILFSSGDSGAPPEYPCTGPATVCLGGTSLFETAASYRAAENGWSGSGGGCSVFEPAPAFQNGFSDCGSFRGAPDLAAIANPSTGALTYLGSVPGLVTGFYVVGGTSLACPVMAALVADIDAARAAAGQSILGQNLGQLIYQSAANPFYHYRFFDITIGNNGFPAGPGWDRITGLGVPMGPSLANYLVSLP